MLLVKEPVPEPSVVFEFAVVGLAVVLQHTPLAVTADPPSDVMLPPLLAAVEVTDVTSAVVNAGATAPVLKLRSFP